MRMAWLAVGFVLIGAGLVWVAQGLNLPFAPGSFMMGQPIWAVIGLVAILAGAVAVIRGRRPA
jgi:hypothetical protein